MCGFRQRLIEGYLVPTKVILDADATRLDRGEFAGPKHRRTVVLCAHNELHLCRDHLIDVLQKFSTHVLCEMHQSLSLLRGGLIVNQQYSFSRIRVLIGIP